MDDNYTLLQNEYVFNMHYNHHVRGLIVQNYEYSFSAKLVELKNINLSVSEIRDVEGL